MNINKEQAIKRLNAIEEETKELRAIINKKDSDWKTITSLQKAIEYLGEDDQDVLEYVFMNGKNLRVRAEPWSFSEKSITRKALEICIKAINQGWEADWNNSNEKKWYNYFERRSSGWAFDIACCDDYCSSGFGLYFQSEEKAQHGSKYFKNYYDILLG